MAKTHLEIERRWLLKGLPSKDFLTSPKTHFIQYTTIYVFLDPNLEVRIQRRIDHHGPVLVESPEVTFPLVMKLGHGLVRQESPKLLADPKIFSYYYYDFSPKLPLISVSLWKIFLANGQTWEIKMPDFTDHPVTPSQYDFVLAELEFDTVKEAAAFKVENAPMWFQELAPKEVTNDPRYNMRSLAVHGIPNPR